MLVIGNDTIIKLYSDQSEQSIETKSKNEPCKWYRLALTKNGDLMYTDHHNQTVNIVKGKTIDEVMKLTGRGH